VPFLNLLFFVLLSLFPERSTESGLTSPKASWFARIVPNSEIDSAALALLITVPAGTALAVLGTQVLRNYGWGLFVALPFAMGLAAAVIQGTHAPRTMNQSMSVACLSVGLLGLALLAFAVEGYFCLLMATPIALVLATFGGVCGYYFQRRRWIQEGASAFLSVLLLFVPGVQWMEHSAAPQPPTFVVRSTIDVDARPEEVWKQVVAFTEIPPPTEWLFRAGVAYPIRAEIVGSGVGAERHCVFSTRAFVEPIEIWDEPHLLKFSVTSNPAPMQEWTPYSHIEPAHLHGFLVSNGGQFLLTPLPGGRTRIEGTTWYRHGLWPSTYWRWWSDAIIHQIHMRVLRHIRNQAEKAIQAPRAPAAADPADQPHNYLGIIPDSDCVFKPVLPSSCA
jgi:hypothetical protein